MRIAFIPPIKYLSLEQYGDDSFVLAHMWKNEEYRKYYSALENRLIIIDNGAYEGELVSDEVLIDIARELSNRNDVIVVAPDVLFNASETYEKTMNFADKCDFPMMAVPQAKSAYEWVEQTKLYRRFKWLGAPIWLDRVASRPGVLQRVNHPRIHLLGLDSPWELLAYRNMPNVLSVDTSLPFTLAKYKERIVFADRKKRERVDNEEVDLRLAIQNCIDLLTFC